MLLLFDLGQSDLARLDQNYRGWNRRPARVKLRRR
jgi:hypothetical protein